MGFRVEPVEQDAPRRHRSPRVTNGTHLAFIRQLPCAVCGERPAEAAHIRSGSRRYGKRDTGMQERPSDFWTLPMCAGCHRTDRDAQHAGNELAFYKRHGIDPFATALALWAASGDIETMEQIVAAARLTTGARA